MSHTARQSPHQRLADMHVLPVDCPAAIAEGRGPPDPARPCTPINDPRTHRRLAAILAADIAGYSRLIGADEAGTLIAMQNVWAGIFNPAVAAHRGRVAKTMGDGALVEFASAVDAVDCAVAVQIAMAAMNAASGRTPMEFRTAGRDLGVTSVLEGSIRRAGNRLRITAQLIDARTGAHLWAERCDRDLTDIFAVQDEVTLQIVGALRVTLQPVERSRLAAARTVNVEAPDQFLQGRAALLGPDKDAVRFQRAVAAFQRAIERDPDYAAPYAGLAMSHTLDFPNQWSGVADPLATASNYATTALEKGPTDPDSHYVSSVVKLWQKDLDGALVAAERALALSPSYSFAHGATGTALVYLGQPEKAMEHFQRALLLEPGYGHQTMHFMGICEFLMGHYREAEATFRKRIRQMPNTDLSRVFLAATLGQLGQSDAARAVWTEMMAINPKYSLAEHLGRSPFRRPQDVARITEGLAKAGLPD